MTLRTLAHLLLCLGIAGAAAPMMAQPGTSPSDGMKPDSTARARKDAAIGSIVDAERTFRADVARLGVRDGFIRNFAADGVLFRPRPVNAIEFLGAQESQPGLLEWEPAFAAVAASNDLGFTTGPWTYRPGEADSVVASGFYATVWRRDAGGAWRAVIDHGVGLGRPSAVPKPQAVATPRIESVLSEEGGARAELGSGDAPTRPSLPDRLRGLDRDLSIPAGRVEAVTRFLAVVSDDARVLRQGKLPITGKALIESLLMGNPAGITYVPAGAGVSQLMDFAYTWGGYWPGILEGGAPPGEETGGYLHVWRHEPSGWRLLFELLSPHPPGTTRRE